MEGTHPCSRASLPMRLGLDDSSSDSYSSFHSDHDSDFDDVPDSDHDCAGESESDWLIWF